MSELIAIKLILHSIFQTSLYLFILIINGSNAGSVSNAKDDIVELVSLL